MQVSEVTPVTRQSPKKQTDFPKLFVSVRELSARYGVTPVTIWRWVREGKFPEPVRLSANATRWRLADVERFEQERGAA